MASEGGGGERLLEALCLKNGGSTGRQKPILLINKSLSPGVGTGFYFIKN